VFGDVYPDQKETNADVVANEFSRSQRATPEPKSGG
jgi:hypothetical protein